MFIQVLYSFQKDMDSDQKVRWFSLVWYTDTQVCGMKSINSVVIILLFLLPAIEAAKNIVLRRLAKYSSRQANFTQVTPETVIVD